MQLQSAKSGARPVPQLAGGARRLHGRARLARHVVPRDARRRQRRPDCGRQGSDCLRLGLPRGHLRRLRVPGGRRRRTAPTAGTTVCQLHMRRFKDNDTAGARALAGQGVSRSSRTSSSIAARSIASSRPAATRRSTCGGAPDGNAILDPEGTSSNRRWIRRPCIGCGACVAACKNASAAPLHLRQGQPPRAPAAGPGRARHAGRSRWSTGTTPKGSAAVRTRASAKRSARRRFRSPTSRG